MSVTSGLNRKLNFDDFKFSCLDVFLGYIDKMLVAVTYRKSLGYETEDIVIAVH